MKSNYKFLIIVLLLGWLSLQNTGVYAQFAGCTPIIGVDPENNGELNPSGLPPATLGQPYYQVMSFLPPPQSSGFNLTKIQLDELRYIPAGINWETNSNNSDDYLYVGTWYCIEISGTPTGPPGIYEVEVWANAWISVLGVEFPAPQNPNYGGTITVDVLPRVQNLSGGGYACLGDTNGFTVTLDDTDTATTYWLLRDGGHTFIKKQGTGNAVHFTGLHQEGVYTVMATGNHDADTTDQTHPMALAMNNSVNIQYLPVVDLGPDFSMSVFDTDTISPGDNFNSYTWNNSNHLPYQVLIGSVLGVGQHEFYVTVQDTNGCNGSDTITVTVFDPTGIEQVQNNYINIFPNPARKQIFVEFLNDTQDSFAEIFDLYGRKIIHSTLSNRINCINTSMLKKGNYLIIIKNNAEVLSKKMITIQ